MPCSGSPLWRPRYSLTPAKMEVNKHFWKTELPGASSLLHSSQPPHLRPNLLFSLLPPYGWFGLSAPPPEFG